MQPSDTMTSQVPVRQLRDLGLWLATVVASVAIALAQQDSPSAQQAVIGKYCVTCHSAKLRTGGLSLQDADLTTFPPPPRPGKK